MKFVFYAVFVILISSAVMLVGCSPNIATEEAVSQTPQTKTAVPSASPTAAPTPIKTTAPDVMTVPTETPEPTVTLTATPTPTAMPTAKPDASDADSKVTIADGFYYIKLNDDIKQRITGVSYPQDDEEIAISYDDLRYIKLLYCDFEGIVQEGELIVNKKLADEVTQIFYELFKAKYPLESVRLVDDFGEPGDDNLSMAANNTSAFNYRRVTGSKTLSRHSYGVAIDINPKLNPYIDGDRFAPENGAEYADRTKDFPGKIDHDDLCYKLFIAHGWTWGGDWKGDKDYQHFSKDIKVP